MHFDDFLPRGTFKFLQSLFPNKRQPPKLPPEIWVIILGMVIDISMQKFTEVSSLNFPQFLRDWQTDRFQSNEEWKRLRLVCRDWFSILNQRSAPRLHIDSPSRLEEPTGARSLYLANVSQWPKAEFELDPLNQNILSFTRNLTFISTGSCKSVEARRAFVDFIFTYAEYFPNVKYLSIDAWDSQPPEFWKRLQKAYPLLVALQIRGKYSGMGNIRLPHLEIFILGLLVLPNCTFPSLKHVSIHAPVLNNYWGLLYDHGHSLESLITGSNTAIAALGDRLWTSFPKLRLLGSALDIQERVVSPPPDHPFDYLWVLGPWIPTSQVVDNILARFPRLRYLTCDREGVLSSNTFLIQTSRWKIGGRDIEVEFWSQ